MSTFDVFARDLSDQVTQVAAAVDQQAAQTAVATAKADSFCAGAWSEPAGSGQTKVTAGAF